jgi:hypothetical protein
MGIVWKPSVTGTASRAGKFAVTSAGSQGLVSASGLALQQAMWAPLGSGRSSAAAAAAAAAGGAAAAAAGGAGVRKNPSAAQAGNTCGCKSSAWMAELIICTASRWPAVRPSGAIQTSFRIRRFVRVCRGAPRQLSAEVATLVSSERAAPRHMRLS